ncbi:hypothetical protein ABK040_005468 [Willaertia magna]
MINDQQQQEEQNTQPSLIISSNDEYDLTDEELPSWMQLPDRLTIRSETKSFSHIPPKEELQTSKYPHLQESFKTFYEPFTVLERQDNFNYKTVPFKPIYTNENHIVTSVSTPPSVSTPQQASQSSPSLQSLFSGLTGGNNAGGKSIVDSFFKALYTLDTMASSKEAGDNNASVNTNILPSSASIIASTNPNANQVDDNNSTMVSSDDLSPQRTNSLHVLKDDSKRKTSFFKKKDSKNSVTTPTNPSSSTGNLVAPKEKTLLDGYDVIMENNDTNDLNPTLDRKSSIAGINVNNENEQSNNDNGESEEEMMLKKLSLVEYAKYCSQKRRNKQFDFLLSNNLDNSLITKNSEDNLPSSTTRLMSCLKPNFKYRPLETTMCFRDQQRLSRFPVQKKAQLLITCQGPPRFERNINEIFYYSMCLYDIDRGCKISEDYNFHFLTKEQFENLPDGLKNYLKLENVNRIDMVSPVLSTQAIYDEKKLLFTISHVNESIHLVMFVYRLPTSSIKDALKPYVKKDMKDLDQWEKNYKDLKDKGACYYRQAFMFGFCPLFMRKGHQLHLITTKYDVKPLYCLDDDFNYKNTFDIVNTIKLSIQKKGLKNLTVVEGGFLVKAEVFQNRAVMEKKRKFIHSRDRSGDLGPTTGSVGSALLQTSYMNSPQSFEGDSIVDTTSINAHSLNANTTLASSLSSENSSSPSNSLFLSGTNSGNSGQRRPSSDLINDRKLSVDESLNEDEMIHVMELPVSTSKYTNMEHYNNLFVYPLCAQFDKAVGKNIFVEVLFKSSDKQALSETTETFNSEARIASKFSRENRDYDYSCLAYDEKQPHFFDEFKIDLPEEPDHNQHLVFVFYHVDIDGGKKSKKLTYQNNEKRLDDYGILNRAIIGYSFLDLTETKEFENEGYVFKPVFRKHTFSDEINIYKELPENYLKANLQDDKKRLSGKLKLKTQMVSTVDPGDEVLKLFFATLHELHVVTDYQKKDVLNFLCDYVFPQFNKIDYKQVLPLLPVILNLLFGLMCTVSSLLSSSALTYVIEKVEIATFEQVLVILRGCYHYLTEVQKETEAHTRLNNFFSSYIKFILSEPKGAKHPLFSILLRIIVTYIEVPENEKMKPATVSGYINDLAQVTKKRNARVSAEEQQQFEQKRNTLSEHDPIRFAWFIFDVIIKSMSQYFANNSIVNQNQHKRIKEDDDEFDYPVTEHHILNRLTQLIDNMVVRLYKLLLASGTGRQNIGISGNRNLALFVRDLLTFFPNKKQFIEHLVNRYVSSLDGLEERKLRLKVEFISIIADYDYYIPLNLQLLRDHEKYLKNKKSEDTAVTTDQTQQPEEENPITLASILTNLFYDVVKSGNDKLLVKMSKILLDHFCKIDFDSRYQEDSRRYKVAELYLDFVNMFLDNEEYLTRFKNDNLYVVVAVCILWILRGLSQDKLVKWWKTRPLFMVLNTFTFLEQVTVAFSNLDFKSTIEDDRGLRVEVMCIVSYLLSIFTQKETVEEIAKELLVQDENIRMLEDLQISDPYLLKQQQIAILFEAKNVKSQSPSVGLFFRFVCSLLMNIILQLTMRSETEVCHLVFTQCLQPLLTDSVDQLVVKELYDETIPKKERVPVVEKKRVEQKWRWLVGSVLMHLGFTQKQEQNVHDVVYKSLDLLLKPYESLMPNSNEMEETDDNDVMLDEDGTIRAGTFRKLVERMLEIYIPPGDKEEHGKFKHIFQICYSSFTTPLQLLYVLINIYRSPQQQNANIIRIRVEQFLCDWVRDSFHEYDNRVIAELVKFLLEFNNELKNNTKTKIKRYAIKNLLNFKQEQQQQKVQYETVQLPKGLTYEELVKPVVDIKEWKVKKSQRKNLKNPFDRNFDFLQWPAVELARQFCLIDAKLFKKIEPKEFFDNAWADKDYKYELAPTLCAITDRTNSISYWVRNRILLETNMENRKKILKKFVDILRELLAMNNFTSVMAISSGLNSAPISRLRTLKTSALSESDLQLIDECENLFSTNFSLMRKKLESLSIERLPSIPFTGVFLTDVTFTKDGNQDLIDHPTNTNKQLVNFKKRRTYYKTIRTVQDLQTNCHYSFKPIPFLEYVLKEEIFHNLNTDDKELFNLSLKVEPRK